MRGLAASLLVVTMAASAQTAPAAEPPAQAATAPAVTATQQGGTIKGTIKAGTVPLPGVAVTATSTLTGKKYTTTTDIDGAYQMQVPRNGRYVVKTELTGFASMTKEVVVNSASENGGLPLQTAEFAMDLASRVSAQEETTGTQTASSGTQGRGTNGTQSAVARVGRGTQSLNVQDNENADTLDATTGQSNAGVQMPSLGDVSSTDSSAATESIAVSGQQGQINGLAGFSEDDLRNRIDNMRREGFNNGDIAGSLMGVMQTGTFGGPQGGPGGGGFGGPGGGPGGGFGGGRGGFGGGGFGGGFGRFRGQNQNAWHGSFGYNGYNSALNANNYSVTGVPIPKPQAQQNSFVASLTGTPYIPKLTTPNPKQFVFLSFSQNRTTRPTTLQTIVPTVAQRYGDLTPSFQTGQVLSGTVYDPATGKPYGNTNCSSGLSAIDASPTACIPQNELNPAALALLNYYPLPNVTSGLTRYNYQANFPGSTHSTQASGRYNRSFGSAPVRGGRGGFGGFGGEGRGQNRNLPPSLRQSIAENFSYSHQASANQSINPLLSGKSATDGYNVSSSYTVGYGRLNSTATVSWNRSSSLSKNLFTYGGVNPAVDAGIFLADPALYTNPFYYGVPSVSISGGVQSLSDTSPVQSINQTISLSDFVAYRHNRHNMRFGFDFRRIHADSIGTGGDLGAFTFSGFATENPLLQSCNPQTDANGCKQYAASGSSMADFLLGLPQQTTINAGLNKIYLRGNSWDWYAQDDWRMKSNFTFNYGIRWEYFSPYSEKYNRMVNLNVAGAGSSLAVSTVCGTNPPAGAPAGSCQTVTPGSLVKPDKALFSPRIAIAWQPKFKFTKNTVVRSSYGINYNTGQYARFANNLAFQQPFAVTQKNVLSSGGNVSGCTTANMTLNNGFNCSTQVTQSSFAVDPNYRLGMVQAWNLGIQRTLPQGVVLNLDYMGSYAGNLDILRVPNRTPTGRILQNVGQFTYEDSLGYQRMNALAVNVRNRMHKGISLQATYTYAHSIDNASSVGGSGNFVAQNDQDLGAEESNSSFVRRHVLNGSFVLEPPFGPNRAFFNKGGVMSHILDGYNISGTYTFSTGGFATPLYSMSAYEIAAGAPSSLRPNRNFGTSIKGPQTHLEWFNTAAFNYDPTQSYYGNASRNSIELPGTVSVNASLSRNISLGETRSLEMRLNANNVFNTVQYSGVDTTVNSQTFGQVTSAAGMRSFTYNARFRF